MATISFENEKIINYRENKLKNEQIDLNKIDVTVSVKTKKDIPWYIEFILEGLSVDNSVSNALRIVILMLIPVFQYHKSKLVIEKYANNNYNHDQITQIIENVPIYDIDNDLDIIDPQQYLPTDIYNAIFSSYMGEEYEDISDLNSESISKTANEERKLLPKIVMQLSKINNDPIKVIPVSTHDAKLTINGKVMNTYKKYKRVDLFYLQPGHSINLTAEAMIGISQIYGIFNATTTAVSEELSHNKWKIHYETLGQLSAKSIFIKACVIIIRKLSILSEFIEKNYKDNVDKNEIEIELIGESHALGNLISTTLKKCKYVKLAGYRLVHPLEEKILIRYTIYDNLKINAIEVLIEVLLYLTDLYKKILDQIK